MPAARIGALALSDARIGALALSDEFDDGCIDFVNMPRDEGCIDFVNMPRAGDKVVSPFGFRLSSASQLDVAGENSGTSRYPAQCIHSAGLSERLSFQCFISPLESEVLRASRLQLHPGFFLSD